MSGLKLLEEPAGRLSASGSGIFQALADTFARICGCGFVEQSLVGLRILNNSRGFPVHCKDDRAPAFL